MARRQTFLFYCLLLAFPFSVKADENLVELVKKTKPAVVLIQTFNDNNQPIGQGSGFFINNKGHIVTNHHVLEGAFRATVKTSSGVEYPVEGVIAKNADADIVKLVVNIPDANTPFLNLSETIPSEGQDIVVIGNPLGLESTVSSGIVSAVRDIPAFGKILQITAPISPGSSGSPVLNNKGDVIGIATLIITKGQNLNFAVPSDKIIALKETPQTSLTIAIPSDSNDAQQFYQKGLKELWQEDWTAALRYFKMVTSKKSENANAHFLAGFCYLHLDRNANAIEEFKLAIRFNPNSEIVHHYLGVAYANMNRHPEAIQEFKQSIMIDPGFADAHRYLGVSYLLLDKNAEAIKEFKESIRIEPDSAGAHLGLGAACRVIRHYSEAVEAYKRAIKIDPNNASAYDGLGLAYGGLGHYDEAINAFKQAIKIEPNSVDAHWGLGLAYIGNSDKVSALEEYKILKTLDVEKANELFNLIYE